MHTDLVEDGWVVSEKTVADSMRRQGLIARKIKRRNGLTKQDKTAPKFPDLLRRDFTAERANTRWVGDMTEIPTAGGKLYLATVIDLYSRRLLGAATGLHPDADLAFSAITMAVAARGGVDAVNGPNWREDESQRVIFHTDRGSTSTAK
ncbi:DDE-type integrase/transposase/recombinase, partial [Nostocoides australiense]